MKTIRIFKNIAVMLTALLLINSCDKIESPKPMGDAGQTVIKILPGGFNLIALDAKSTSQSAIMFDVRRDAPSEAAYQKTTTCKLVFDQTILDDYNTENGTEFEALPASLATVSPAPAGDGSITIAFAAGEFAKTVTVTIPDATKFDFSKQYGLGYRIEFVDGEGTLSEAAGTEVVVQVLVKNKYDGLYEVNPVSPMVDFTNAGLTGNYPFKYKLATSGAHQCVAYEYDNDYPLHPILNGTSWSYYGSYGLIINFDPSGSGKIESIVNYFGQPAGNTRSAGLDDTGVNTWNPATKTIKVKYFLYQPSVVVDPPHIRVAFDEEWKYLGKR